MKKAFITLTLASLFSVNAFAEFSLTCPEMYERTIIAKERKKERAGDTANTLGWGMLLFSFGAAPVAVGLLLPTVALSVYSEANPKEAKVVDLSYEGSRRLERLTKKARKKINSKIDQEEIAQIVQEGMSSGLYCQGFPHLYTPKEVKEHVLRTLEMKYL